MKFSKELLKTISLVLALLFLFQSCKIYHSKSISIDNAMQSGDNVKIKINDDFAYTFVRIIREDDRIYGVTSSKSETIEYLENMGFEIIQEGKYVKINLPENKIESIHAKNKTLSTLIPVLGVLSLTIVIGLLLRDHLPANINAW